MTPADSTNRPRKVGTAALMALLACVLAAGTVSADTELGHKGTVGPHSLKDTYSNGGARCTYVKTFESETSKWWRVSWIKVRPPVMKAISTKQTVGWRFVVQRSEDHGPWETTYRSPIQKATAYSNSAAAFSAMRIKVIVPPPSSQFSNRHHYRVIVKMMWYRADGSQRGSARHLVDFYREKVDGEVFPGEEDGSCQGIKGQVV